MEDEQVTEWDVISITTKCPICGNTYIDTGKNAMDLFNAAYFSCKCGFSGELPIR